MKNKSISDVILLLLIICLTCSAIGYINRDRIIETPEDKQQEDKPATKKIDDDKDENKEDETIDDVVEIVPASQGRMLRNTYSNEKILDPIEIKGSRKVDNLNDILDKENMYSISVRNSKSDPIFFIEKDRVIYENLNIICEKNEDNCDKNIMFDRYIIYGMKVINNAFYYVDNSEYGNITIYVTTEDGRLFMVTFSTNSKYYDNLNIRQILINNIDSIGFPRCLEDKCEYDQDDILIITKDNKIYSNYCFQDEKNCSFKQLINN